MSSPFIFGMIRQDFQKTKLPRTLNSIGLLSILLLQITILSRQNCLYLLRSVYSFFKQVLVFDDRLQKRNFGR